MTLAVETTPLPDLTSVRHRLMITPITNAATTNVQTQRRRLAVRCRASFGILFVNGDWRILDDSEHERN